MFSFLKRVLLFKTKVVFKNPEKKIHNLRINLYIENIQQVI